MQLLGVVVKAFDASADASPKCRCVLTSETTLRGFRGRRQTERWCCPLKAFVGHLIDSGLVAINVSESRLMLFPGLATEMAWWERVRARNDDAQARALMSYAAMSAAYRVGLVAGSSGSGDDVGAIFAADPAWAHADRRREALDRLLNVAGGRTYSAFAKELSHDPDQVTAWLTHQRVPGAEALEVIALWGKRHAGLSKAATWRELRLHYALAAIVDAIADGFDRDFAIEVSRLFTAIVRAVSKSIRDTNASPSDAEKAMLIALLRTTHVLDHVDPFAFLLGANGASEECIEDVRLGHAAWRSALPAELRDDERAEFWLLLEDLPRIPYRLRTERHGQD